MSKDIRQDIQLTDTVMDVLLKMSEGNPGAASVLSTFLKEPMDGFGVVLDLDDMNIRGTQIWVGYKDYCGSDIEKFKKLAHERDEKMVAHINREGVRGNHQHKAVRWGGSSKNGRKLLNGKSANPNVDMLLEGRVEKPDATYGNFDDVECQVDGSMDDPK